MHMRLRYGWWAFNSGERKTALVYGMKAIGAMPWKSEGWRLLVCAIVKKPKNKNIEHSTSNIQH